MREVVIDTESTGLDPSAGHRVVEIGCVELANHVPTGAVYHTYIDPERDMPDEAFAVHGLSRDFLAEHQPFGAVAEDFLAFIGDDPLVIHNARFDLGFLNAELALLERTGINGDRAIDTVGLARRRYPGAQVSLDALCRRFEIDLSARDKHGALLDAELLARVYLELVGGRQPGLDLAAGDGGGGPELTPRQARAARAHQPTPAERAAHDRFVDTLDEPIWRRTGADAS